MKIDATRVAALAILLYGAKRYWRNWGTTKDECAMNLPGDELLREPMVKTTEGVWIDLPVEQVWPWVVQLGQDRGGCYTYDTVENACGLDHHSADRIHAEWQNLSAGDTVRFAPPGWLGRRDGVTLPVAKVIPQEAIVLHGSPPAIPWDIVWSIHLMPRWDDRCRLLVRTRVGLRHPAEVVALSLAGPLHSALTRRMLLGIKHRAERQRHSAVVEASSS